MYDLKLKKQQPVGRKNKPVVPRKPLSERLPLKKLKRLLTASAMMVLAVVLGVELYTLFFKVALLKLEKIEVTNIHRLKREDVIAMAGVSPGDDMLHLNLRHVGELLEKNPWVEEVSIRRYFPHTLSVEIKEREPEAIVNMGYLYYMDRHGDLFKPLTAGDPLDYPVLTGLDEEALAKDPAGSKAMLESCVAILSLLKAGTVFRVQDISEIHMEKNSGFTLITMHGGVAVRLGKERFMEKMQRLARIYKDLQPQMLGLSYIDLDFNDRIIVKKG